MKDVKILKYEEVVALYMIVHRKYFVDHSESYNFAAYLKECLSNDKFDVKVDYNLQKFAINNKKCYNNMFIIGSGFVGLGNIYDLTDLGGILSNLDNKMINVVLRNKDKTKSEFENYKFELRHARSTSL